MIDLDMHRRTARRRSQRIRRQISRAQHRRPVVEPAPLSGHGTLTAAVVFRLLTRKTRSRPPVLTDDQRLRRYDTILELSGQGLTNQQIAVEFGLSGARVSQILSGPRPVVKPPKSSLATEVIDLALLGLSPGDIARQLGISEARVRRRLPVPEPDFDAPIDTPLPWALCTWKSAARAYAMAAPTYYETRAEAEEAAPVDRPYSIVDITRRPDDRRPGIGEILHRSRLIENPYPVHRQKEIL